MANRSSGNGINGNQNTTEMRNGVGLTGFEINVDIFRPTLFAAVYFGTLYVQFAHRCRTEFVKVYATDAF